MSAMGSTQRFWEMDEGPAARMAGKNRPWPDPYDEEEGEDLELPAEFYDEDE